jgi:hypothetical protein
MDPTRSPLISIHRRKPQKPVATRFWASWTNPGGNAHGDACGLRRHYAAAHVPSHGKAPRSIGRTWSLAPGELPVFDAIQRGTGPDAHTASLFPGEPLIAHQTGIVAAVHVERLKQNRITLLPGVLKRARHTLCFTTGAEKTESSAKLSTGHSIRCSSRLRSRCRTPSGTSIRR